jgi:RimJ/RimL family protein N-acetyltransferase
VLTGARISLGPVREEDLPHLARWINDRELVLLSSPYRPVHFSDHEA